MSQSFSTGHQFTLNSTAPAHVEPYDSTYQFNRVVYSRPGKPLYDIYSIDPLKILHAIEADKLSDLYKITLLGRQIMQEHLYSGGTGIWDTLFNSAQQKAFTACVFMAGHDYRPLSLNRVALSSQFLNFSMQVSRVQKNQVQPGDRFGIGINDLKDKLYYVLLYRVDELCQVTMNHAKGGRPYLQPAANITMEHALRIEYDGSVTSVDMEDNLPYDEERATPFVSWIVDSVADIVDAYPFKPHFTPFILDRINVDKMLTRMDETIPNAKTTTWEEFKVQCKNAYEQARNEKDGQPPVIEVVSFVDGDNVIVTIDVDYNPDNISYSFSRTEFEADSLTEGYINNADLVGADLNDTPGVTKLPATDLVGERLVRYFKVNY